MNGDLERRLADLVSAVSGGEISAEDALAGEHSLTALGLTSLAWIRLIDAIEDSFGVDIDLAGDLTALDRVDALAAHLSALMDAR
jgi:acyl carrier protein